MFHHDCINVRESFGSHFVSWFRHQKERLDLNGLLVGFQYGEVALIKSDWNQWKSLKFTPLQKRNIHPPERLWEEGGLGKGALMHWLQIFHCNWANLPHLSVCINQPLQPKLPCLVSQFVCIQAFAGTTSSTKKGKVSPAGSWHKDNVCRVSAPVSALWLPAADDASDTVHRGLTEDRIMRGQWSGAGLRRWQLTLMQQGNGGSENTGLSESLQIRLNLALKLYRF